jgi:hypothetical protein
MREFEEIVISSKVVEVTVKKGKLRRLLSGFRPRIWPLGRGG